MIKSRLKFLIGILFILQASLSFGQVGNYWGESFSTKSALLSGAVVGGYEDESSIYYNPSILSDSNVNQFAFANGLATVDAIRYENALGEGEHAGNWESSVDPGFISLNLYPKKKLGLVWKVAFFNKTKYDNGLSAEVRETYNVYDLPTGNEQYLGRVKVRIEFNDYWYGAGVAKRLNNKLSVGVSLFARYSSIRHENSKLIEITGSEKSAFFGKVATNDISTNLRGYSWRGTFKIGINYRVNDVLRLGMTITTPSFTMVSSTSVTKNDTRVNVPNQQDSTILPDYLYDEYSDDLNLRIKDPLSIAGGVDYISNKYRWNVSLEWFAPVAPYKVIDQSTGEVFSTISPEVILDPDNLSYAGGGKSILNFAIGMEKFTSSGRSWLFGFKTDFNTQKGFSFGELDGLNKMVSARSDYYHFSAGKNFEFLNFNVLFGLQYSLSRAYGLQGFANFSAPVTFDPNNPYSLEGTPQNNMSFKGDALTVFVGLTLKKKN